MTVTSRPEVPIQVITPEMVRSSVKRAKRGLAKAAWEIVWQIEMEAWRTLGYSSWGAMREAEYGGAAVMVPSKIRPGLIADLKSIEVGKTARGGSKHLTDQEIANTLGVSRSQVQDDLNGNNKKSRSGQNADTDDDVIDAEIVEDEDYDFDDVPLSGAGGSVGPGNAGSRTCECGFTLDWPEDTTDEDKATVLRLFAEHEADCPEATQTSEAPSASDAETDPTTVESASTSTCPTCHGTGKVTR